MILSLHMTDHELFLCDIVKKQLLRDTILLLEFYARDRKLWKIISAGWIRPRNCSFYLRWG